MYYSSLQHGMASGLVVPAALRVQVTGDILYSVQPVQSAFTKNAEKIPHDHFILGQFS